MPQISGTEQDIFAHHTLGASKNTRQKNRKASVLTLASQRRHTYSLTLIANAENVKVVQELMRHASSRFTLDVYTQAKAKAKRDAQPTHR